MRKPRGIHRRIVGLAVVTVTLAAAGCGSTDKQNTATRPPALHTDSIVEFAPAFKSAQLLVKTGDYDGAVKLVAGASAGQRAHVRAYVATTIAATAVAALHSGDRRSASRRIRQAARYANTKAVRAARTSLRNAQARAAAHKLQLASAKAKRR